MSGRQVILDTETTGLDPNQGHRIIEIACVEMINRRLTKNTFHQRIHPERAIDEGATQVHGISLEDLEHEPKFAAISDAFLNYVNGVELIIHNAPFDVGFLDHELALLSLNAIHTCCVGVIDTLKLAKELHPGQKNNLDALCKRYGVDNAHRTLHGALLDAELLAEVYLAMTRGQESLMIDMSSAAQTSTTDAGVAASLPQRVLHASVEELAAHAALLADIDKECKGTCLWNK